MAVWKKESTLHFHCFTEGFFQRTSSSPCSKLSCEKSMTLLCLSDIREGCRVWVADEDEESEIQQRKCI